MNQRTSLRGLDRNRNSRRVNRDEGDRGAKLTKSRQCHRA